MNKITKLALSIGILFSATSLMAEDLKDLSEKEVIKRESYAVGLELGKNVSKNIALLDDYGVPYDVDMLIEGIRASIKKTPQLSSAEAKQAIDSINAKMKTASKAKDAKQAVLDSKQAVLTNDYLKVNASKKGIIVTASGLQYEVLTEGTGAKPLSTDSVTVHYEGTLINGQVFDSSYARNKPSTFNLSGVIKGWTEGLQYMSEGSKYKFTIPANLAYGARGTKGIPKNATITFIVELLKVNK